MKKTIILGMSVFVWMVSANETVKQMPKQKVEKTVLPQKQVNTKVQESTLVKHEAKSKSQSYPRGNIATH